ncbi:hypothetical protein Tco_0582272, partial [Tanacetum coccineum]
GKVSSTGKLFNGY